MGGLQLVFDRNALHPLDKEELATGLSQYPPDYFNAHFGMWDGCMAVTMWSMLRHDYLFKNGARPIEVNEFFLRRRFHTGRGFNATVMFRRLLQLGLFEVISRRGKGFYKIRVPHLTLAASVREFFEKVEVLH
jgi:hypothetical protein